MGSAFDGRYGVDTEDILAIPSIDFGSLQVYSFMLTPYIIDILKSQLFPDQTEYFPKTGASTATDYIGAGGKWVAVHSNTALL